MRNVQVHGVLAEAGRTIIDKLILGIILTIGESEIFMLQFLRVA